MNALVRSAAFQNSHAWIHNNTPILRRLYLALAALLIIAYPLLTLLPEPQAKILKTYGLNHSSYYLVIVPIVVLLILIWAAGFYGSLILKKYAWIIRGSRDGRAMNIISDGLLVLSLGLPITSVVSAISALVERNHLGAIAALTIFNNYLSLLIMGISFMLIAVGAEHLYDIVRPKISPWPQKIWVLAFIVFSTLYTYFIIFQSTLEGGARKEFFLPNWLLLISVVIPYLYIWYRGINSAYCLLEYRVNVSGKLYKSALSLMAAGITMVIISSVASRTITSLAIKLTSLDLTPLLFIIYALLALTGVGFLLIAAGARRLRKIEEV
jgi:hypothetical protein